MTASHYAFDFETLAPVGSTVRVCIRGSGFTEGKVVAADERTLTIELRNQMFGGQGVASHKLTIDKSSIDAIGHSPVPK